jgi:hypothetical protein
LLADAFARLAQVALAGFVAVPSKYRELARGVEGPWLGYSHHRWVASLRRGTLKLYPKLSWLEHHAHLAAAVGQPRDGAFDLSFFWRGRIPWAVANGDYMGPSMQHTVEYFEVQMGPLAIQ